MESVLTTVLSLALGGLSAEILRKPRSDLLRRVFKTIAWVAALLTAIIFAAPRFPGIRACLPGSNDLNPAGFWWFLLPLAVWVWATGTPWFARALQAEGPGDLPSGDASRSARRTGERADSEVHATATEPPSVTLLGNWLWRLDRPYAVRFEHHEIRIPEGFEFDLASIPRVLWPIFAPQELTLAAPLVHDYLYRYGGKPPEGSVCPPGEFTRREADRFFLELMTRARAVPVLRAQIAYWMVRLFGWSSFGKAEPPSPAKSTLSLKLGFATAVLFLWFAPLGAYLWIGASSVRVAFEPDIPEWAEEITVRHATAEGGGCYAAFAAHTSVLVSADGEIVAGVPTDARQPPEIKSSGPYLPIERAGGKRVRVDAVLERGGEYCFQFISTRSLSNDRARLLQLQSELEEVVDKELRTTTYQQDLGGFSTFSLPAADYEDLRRRLIERLSRTLAASDEVFLARADSFFNLRVEAQDIAGRYREDFESIALRTAGARLTAISAFEEHVTQAVDLLQKVAKQEYRVRMQVGGESEEGLLAAWQLAMTSTDPQVRRFGQLLSLLPQQLEARLKGVPEDGEYVLALSETWKFESPGADESTFSIEQRVSNIEELSAFLSSVASSALVGRLSLTGAQANVVPLTQEDVDRSREELEELKRLLEQLTGGGAAGEAETLQAEALREQIARREARVERLQRNTDQGLVPQVNLINQAAVLLADAATQLQVVREVLLERSALISVWVEKVLAEEKRRQRDGATFAIGSSSVCLAAVTQCWLTRRWAFEPRTTCPHLGE